MKKGCLACFLSFVLVLLSRCGISDTPQESTLVSGSRTQGEQSPGIYLEATPERDEESQPDSPAEDTVSGTAKTIINGFSGTVNCTGDGRLLLAGKRIILMDGTTFEVEKEAENTAPLLLNPQAYIHGDVCTLMGESFEGICFKLIEYDGDLQVKQITDIEEASDSEREIMACRLLSDGHTILYSNINGFYLFDIASGETRDLTQEDIFVYDFACLEEKGEILFSGSDPSGKRILGKVDMDGKGLQEENGDHLWGALWAFGDHALIGEAELVGKEKEGVVFRYDEKERIRSFPMTDSDENGNITVSCKGAYYGTQTKMQDDALRYLIRIYSSEDGSMIKELPLSYEEYGEDFRLHGYLICDDTGRIILYGTWKGRETDTWIVSVDL